MQPVNNMETPKMEETTCLAQPGQFAKLPTEIRLLVWEALFDLIPTKLNRPTERSTNTLSILSCSRFLYNEIAHHLYKDLARSFLICSKEPDNLGIRMQLESSWVTIERDLDNIQTTRNILEHFPSALMWDDTVYIDILPSNNNDPGRIILLSERVTMFVKLLTELSYTPYVHVGLMLRWCAHDGKARESVPNPADYRPDYDIVLMPFTRLSNWSYHIPHHLSTLIANESKLSNEPIAKRSMISLMREHGSEDQYRLNIFSDLVDSKWLFERWLTDTRIFLDTRLDTLPGETARLLRRRRLAHWFEDGTELKSQYEEQLLTDICNNHQIVMKHDPRLAQARLRHRSAILTHHQICAEKVGTDSRGVPICQNWDSSVWAFAKPDGIGTLSCAETMTNEAIMVFDIYSFMNKQIAQFSADLHWWGVYSKDVFGKRKPWSFMCIGCQELGRPCRWCEEYDVDKACRLCREGKFERISHVE
jgi:hypothetical protein